MMTQTPQRGYSLLEMIVSVGIFGIVMLAATGAYLSLIKLDREARATNDLANNLTFAVDSMARAIRTGTAYKCNNSSASPNCTSTAGTSFGFLDSESPARSIVYTLSSNQIVATINGTTYPITDPRVRIESMSFYVRGVGTGDGTQPNVTFTIVGSLQTDAGQSPRTFTLQSGATQRFLDL